MYIPINGNYWNEEEASFWLFYVYVIETETIYSETQEL